MIKILIVEDEKPISDLIKLNLIDAGYYCQAAFDGKTALDMVEQNQFDLILLDIMLPIFSGYDLIEYIHPLEIPTIFITAKANVEDRVKGLKLGAEDYIIKPFAIVELLARIEVVLRRFHKSDDEILIDNVKVNQNSRQVFSDGILIDLTNKEYELLLLFLRNRNIALFRDVIFERIWENDYLGDSRTVDLHVQRLRKKLGWENKIKSIYKVGYRFEQNI